MQYAARLPTRPSTRTLAGPVVALVVGAAAATGAYALIDSGDASVQGSKVIVVESPAPGTADIPGKNESATAAGISSQIPGAAEIPGKNEAATAAGISSQIPGAAEIPGKDEAATAAGISQSTSGLELRGSKASTSSSAGTSSEDAEDARRTDPHGVASTLRDR
jgi:hypothetical protein